MSSEYPAVGPRERCPCGSGKRYKACHGKRAHAASKRYVARTFEGLPGECDWVAMREIVSSATATVKLANDAREVVVATLLPGAAPALVRSAGQVLLGLQAATSTGDASADLAHALVTALSSDASGPEQEAVAVGPRPATAPRLQDLLDLEFPFDVTVHSGFEYWIDPSLDEAPAEAQTMIESANEAVVPCARLTSVDAAYWCDLGERVQVRWVQPYDEEPLLKGLARLHASGSDDFGEGTRLLGTFRAHGLLVPVWDLVDGTTAEQVEEPAAELAERLAQAVAETTPLNGDERRARSGLANRQVTIR
jgi:hypothetical protein